MGCLLSGLQERVSGAYHLVCFHLRCIFHLFYDFTLLVATSTIQFTGENFVVVNLKADVQCITFLIVFYTVFLYIITAVAAVSACSYFANQLVIKHFHYIDIKTRNFEDAFL